MFGFVPFDSVFTSLDIPLLRFLVCRHIQIPFALTHPPTSKSHQVKYRIHGFQGTHHSFAKNPRLAGILTGPIKSKWCRYQDLLQQPPFHASLRLVQYGTQCIPLRCSIHVWNRACGSKVFRRHMSFRRFGWVLSRSSPAVLSLLVPPLGSLPGTNSSYILTRRHFITCLQTTFHWLAKSGSGSHQLLSDI